MDNLKNMLMHIKVQDLIAVFNIQIAVALFLVFFIFRGLFSQIILKVIFWMTKQKKKVKETNAYKIFNRFFIFLGLYLSIRLLKLDAQTLANVNSIFRVICIIFITNIINANITNESRWFQHSKSDIVNNFICKIIRGIVWIISIYIILKELGVNLTGLVAGFGIRQCDYFTGSAGYCKKFAESV